MRVGVYRHKHHPRLLNWTSIVVVVGCGLLVIAGLGFYDYIHRTQTGPTTPEPSRVLTTSAAPSEKKPVSVSPTYKVPANQPRAIEIASLAVTAYIQKVGVTSKGAMATPNNIYFTGWYTGSVVPGEKGVSIINGHVGGRYTSGVFKNLKSLKSGAAIRIQMGDLSWRSFQVVSTNSYSLNDTAGPLYTATPSIDKELHLITCDGTFDDASQSYDRRVVVVAKYVE